MGEETRMDGGTANPKGILLSQPNPHNEHSLLFNHGRYLQRKQFYLEMIHYMQKSQTFICWLFNIALLNSAKTKSSSQAPTFLRFCVTNLDIISKFAVLSQSRTPQPELCIDAKVQVQQSLLVSWHLHVMAVRTPAW